MRHPSPSPSADGALIRQEVERFLEGAPSFRSLQPAARREMAESLSRVAAYLAGANGGSREPLAGQLAPDLRQRLAPQGQPSSPASPSPAPGAEGPPAPGAGGSTGAVGRVGEVARATLAAIDFPTFVASLIQGTFQAIVDSSIQQMEAYAQLLKSVASTVDRFMDDNITDGAARDYLADQYGGLLVRETSGGQPRLSRNPRRQQAEELPSFFKDLGFTSADDLDDDALEQVVVPAARKHLAERRQQTLATMVLMGIKRVVVDDGEISAKLMFHIDAQEATQLRFDQTKTTSGNMAGRAGSNPFSAQAVMVNTTSLNAQSDINVRADLTGQVKVKFRTESFPLERFADSMAIQLISSNAKVPPPPPPPSNGSAPAPAAAAPGAPAPAPPSAAPGPGAGAQGLGPGSDPWAPGTAGVA